jgi:uncharacterized protein YcnI
MINPFNTIKGKTETIWTEIHWAARGQIRDLATWLTGAMAVIYERFIKPFEDIRTKSMEIVNDLISKMKSAFANFKLHIPLPHFSVTWDDIGFGISVPDVGVSWYGAGGDFWTDGPMLIGVGESGPEHVQITPKGKEQETGGSGRTYNITVNASQTSLDEAGLLRMLRRAELVYG